MGNSGEYTVFPKSKYQSDGWEPFLPNHPLADTAFEHLALEFQARKRKLDKVRASQALENLGTNASKQSLPRGSDGLPNALTLDLSNTKSDQKDRLRLVDEDFQEYVTFAGYQPSADQIKRFLYVEARRLSCAFPGFESGGGGFASVKNDRKKEVTSTAVSQRAEEVDEEEEEEKYREALRRFADIHRRPKIIETIIHLSGSGAAKLTTEFRSDAYVQTLALFKTGLCRTLHISKSDLSILGVKNTTVGKLGESVEIDIQIFTYRMDLCHRLSETIQTCISNGNLASELNNIGLPVYVTLRAGPIVFQYSIENDYTQSLFGAAAAELLRNRISKLKSAAFGAKLQQIQKTTASLASENEFIPTTDYDPAMHTKKVSTAAEQTTISGIVHQTHLHQHSRTEQDLHQDSEEEPTSHSSGHSKQKAARRYQDIRRSKSTTLGSRKHFFVDDKDTMLPGLAKGGHGFELHPRPATVAATRRLLTQSPDMLAHLSRGKKRPKDGMDKWSLAIPAHSAAIESEDMQDLEKIPSTTDEHVPKLMEYFAKASASRKAPSMGFVTHKVQKARLEWDKQMTEIREAARKGKETDNFTMERKKIHSDTVHRDRVENNRKRRAQLAKIREDKASQISKAVDEGLGTNSPFITNQETLASAEQKGPKGTSIKAKPSISLPLAQMKTNLESNQASAPNVYDLLIDDDSDADEGDDAQAANTRLSVDISGSSLHLRSRSLSEEKGGTSNVVKRKARRSRSPNRLNQPSEEQIARAHKHAQVVPLDMGRAERLGLAALAQSHVDHVLKDDVLLNAVDFSKEAVARNLKAEKQFLPPLRRIERKVQLTFKKGGILTCMVCKDRRKLSVSNCLPALLDILNPKGIEGLEEIDCPYCLGLNPKYRFDPINYNNAISDDGWEPPKFAPPLGPNQLVLQVPVSESSLRVYSPYTIASVWLSSIFGNFYAISTQGSIVEAELGTGRIVRRFNTRHVEVNCSCSTKTHLYLGVGCSILEMEIESGTHTRILSGMKSEIVCCSASFDSKMLAAGATDCTTFLWELESGRILRHIVDCYFSLPDQIKHLADEFPSRSQTFTFRHHIGPVSCCTLRKDAVISGSWDGTICVASLSSYRERWTEEYVIKMLEKKSRSLSREAKMAAVDLAERTQERKKSVRIYRQQAENLENLKNTLEIIKSTLTTKRPRLQSISCRKFLCPPDSAGRVTCLQMQYLKKIGFMLFAGYSDGKVRQWDIKSEAVVRVFVSGRDHDVTCLCFGGDRMFTAGEHGIIKVWNIAGVTQNPGTAIHKNEFDIVGHQHGIVSMKLCGNALFSAAEDNTIRVWNLLACDFETNVPETTKESESQTQGDTTAREAPLTSRSAKSSMSTGSSLSSFFGGSVQGDFAGKVLSISIFEEPVVFKLDEEESASEETPVDISPSPEMIKDNASNIESDSDDDNQNSLEPQLDNFWMPPLSESEYIDLLEMASTLPNLNGSLKESIDAANKWSRRLVAMRPDQNKH